MKERGFAAVVIILIVVIILAVAGGIWYYEKYHNISQIEAQKKQEQIQNPQAAGCIKDSRIGWACPPVTPDQPQ